jgi:hypothetical protein
MMRLRVRLAFGHAKFPAANELALGDALHSGVVRQAKALISRAAQGTEYGAVYSEFEFLKRDYPRVRRIVREVLRSQSAEHLAKITEQQPLASYPVLRADHRHRSPMKDRPPPSYLTGRAWPAKRKGPARRLFSGKWCGHGRDTYAVCDIRVDGVAAFRVRLPQPDDRELNPPVVLAVTGATEFPVYDSREHDGSIYADEYRHLQPRLRGYYRCPNCGGRTFHLAVGFEIPADSEGPNSTSWFALAAECEKCSWMDVLYDDETQ